MRSPLPARAMRQPAAGFALALAARFAASRKAPLIWIGEDFAGLEQGAL